jgi:hypothetical protein
MLFFVFKGTGAHPLNIQVPPNLDSISYSTICHPDCTKVSQLVLCIDFFYYLFIFSCRVLFHPKELM